MNMVSTIELVAIIRTTIILRPGAFSWGQVLRVNYRGS